MNKDLRLVASYASLTGNPTDVREAAARLLRKPRRVPKEGRTKAQEKRSATAERNARMVEIRKAVQNRHNSKCVVCGWMPSITLGECHHLISGNGRRRISERVDTCVWVCGSLSSSRCHELAATDPAALRKVAAYCVTEGMTEAAVAVSRRLAKVLESREAEGRREE
jgi:hypothetical protein